MIENKLQPLEWVQLNSSGQAPSARSGHSITGVGKFSIMFGGIDQTNKKNGKIFPNNQVYTVKIIKENIEWRAVPCGGDIPLERSNHAACAISQDKLLIFGGFYTSNLRFNDVYILKTLDFNWFQPPNQRSGMEPKNTESKIGAPEPRANHTANFYKDKVFIFGGHGGVGYQRSSYNDVHFFDCETSEWTKVEIQGGAPPEARGGHSAMVLAEKEMMIIYGGWSSTGQFSDIHAFHLTNFTWCNPDLSHEIPRWYHSSICVPAIPSWKFFVFGGSVGQFAEGENRTLSRLSDEIFYLDVPNIKEMKWNNIPIKGNFPKGRENGTLFWDANDSRLILFGGWANTWLSDSWSLKVNLITGPPYAIYDIQPNKGPLTGKTKVTISGDGFKDSNIVVRFDCGKGTPLEVQGSYVSPNELTCETPAFDQVSKPAIVTLSINKGDYTITQSLFTYYLNTQADQCIAFGPGLYSENSAGNYTIFVIQARNIKGLNRMSGSDIFEVKITLPIPESEPVPEKKEKKEGEEAEVEQVIDEQKYVLDYKLIDNDNGSYTVKYKCDVDCDQLKIQVKYRNQNDELADIRGSPFIAGHKIGNPVKNNELGGDSMSKFMIQQVKDIEQFISKSKSDINIKNRNIQEDVFELLSVKESLYEIQARKQEYLLKLDMVEQCLKKFKEDGINKDDELKKTITIKESWNNLQNMAVTVEKDISSQVKAESDKTKDNLIKFEEILKEYFTNMKKESFYQYKTGQQASQEKLGQVQLKIEEFQKELDNFQYFSTTFGFGEETNGSKKNLEIIMSELSIVKKLWDHIKKCENIFNNYLKLQYTQINPMDMEDEVKSLRKALLDIKGVDRKSNTFLGISEDIKKWATFMPLLNELKDPSMNVEDGRHWAKVIKTVQKEFTVDENLLIQTIWDLKLFNYKDEIEDITDTSKQELKMSKQIAIVQQKWKDVQFELLKHKDTNICTLKLLEENFEALEEHQLLVNNMLLSKYVAYFEKEIEQWKQDLGAIYDVIQLLIEVQKSWSFLENLFIGSQEVQRELPKESKQFEQIHEEMQKIMAYGCQVKNVLKFCTTQDMLKNLEGLENRLKVCEKALNKFLDDKRCAFPRFYFVSVNDLLDILSNGSSPDKINRHMSKIFQAIDNLILKNEGKGERPTAMTMITCVGQEQVDFTKPLKLEGKVEIYLQELIKTMIDTLQTLCQKSIQNFNNLNNREQWLKMDPSQVTLLINFIIWCRDVANGFTSIQGGDLDAMKNLAKKSKLDLTGLIKMVQGDLDRPLRQKIMCMITLDTHSRDIMDKLIVENVRKADEFQWQSQLKFDWDKEKQSAKAYIADASFWYTYEYLGNGPRLVITPLTDRIYVTATQALHLCLGCAPAGPAGTGKTETTKDLASALAKAVYVFNCSPEMNYESLGNIFKGLASSGTWGCFDEFNRLVPEVLSVCSVQFKSVCDGVKAKSARIIIEGDEVNLDPTCGAFITMNPGYLGRSELPEGLKVLFRPITVMVPDLVLICENMLMAEGFIDAKTLANKFFTLYMLCRDLLSKADHYDWGLRAIKSVLVVAGTFKRAEPNISEQALLMRALRDFNIPKITAADNDIFFGLLGDLFPGIHVERKRDIQFEEKIVQTCVETKLFPEPEFILKIVQLGELLQIRHCVFVMGNAGAGKTSTWKSLIKANEKIQKKIDFVDLDPKVVHSRDLYGYMLPSKEWKDGLLSKLLRTYSEMESTNPKWLILDGDLDANWIESMNSVMDDNKILTLANNERIPLKPHMRMIFEIRDLKHSTPATVSRAGILYISDDYGHQWKSFVRSWIELNYSSEKETGPFLQKLFDRYIEPTLNYIKKSCKFNVPVSQISMIISLCRCLKPMITADCKNIEYIFVFCLVWSVGGGLTEKDGIDYRKEFSSWWKGEWKSSVKFPQKGSVFDYYVDQSGEQIKFEEWAKKVEVIDFDTQKNHQMQQFAIPTRETVSTKEFINTFLQVQHPSLIIGSAGAGKTQLANDIIRSISSKYPENYAYTKINFNFYTDSTYLQNMLEAPLKKLAGKQYGPGGKIKMIYYIDDLNMPQLDLYNTQTAIALLRQHADYQHWYDVGKLAIKEIVNCQHLASMNPAAGSFYVNPRYQRHFWLVSVSMPDNESLFIIYNTFLQGHLKYFKPQVQEQVPSLIKSALTLHQTITTTFRKTALNFHYEFNLRHISGVFQGLLIAQPTQFQNQDKIVLLWIHESERVYGDRLVSTEHLTQYRSLMFDLLKKSFSKFNFQRYFQAQNPENLIFCNFVQGIAGDRSYDQMPNEKLEHHVQEALKEYNDNNAYMGLVLFEDAIKHVCKITRIVQAPAGHALLVGVGGSGKQSLSKLASYIMNFTTVNITISATYNMNDFKNDIVVYYFKAGIKDEGLLWLFTEGQITNERFLVYVNDLLASGEIADLYTNDEKEGIINNVRSKVKSDGIPDTRENCWQWFIDKTKKNLHMCLCFSPVGDSFRQRARKFPALVNSTVIDWFQPWPYDALMSVANSFLSEIDLGEQSIREAIVKFMPQSFTVVNQMCQTVQDAEKRYVYTTPKSFLELIKLYTGMLDKKRKGLEEAQERYENGLIKLRETAEQVEEIEKIVKVKGVEAEKKKNDAEKFAAIVGTEKEKVEAENDKANIEAAKCQQIKEDVTAKKESTENDLAAAIPLVEEAKKSLQGIQKKDFVTAKSFTNPPGGVPEVFAAAMLLMAGHWPEAIEIDKNKKPKSLEWKSALKLMKNPEELLNRLQDFGRIVDENQVVPGNVKIVKDQYMSREDFKVEIMEVKSGAAKGICSWVINIVKYWEVIQQVEPKRKALAESTEQLDAATTKLDAVNKIVAELKASLQKLIDEYNAAMDEKNAALNEAERCKTRLDLAQRLVAALGSENERWANAITQIQNDLNLIAGDVLLASAFISYTGPFNKHYRQILIKSNFEKYFIENKIPISPDVNPIKILTDEATIALWNKDGLPSDAVSTENGTILTNSERYPLIIDPQLQGNVWIKEKEKKNKLKCVRLGSANINRDLDLAIETGCSVMIENMDESIDAILMPVISRQFIRRGRNKIMKFGGKDLNLHENFNMFLHTKLSNPHYPPEVQAETTLINFTVTEDGLADQLLTLVVGRERPDLAKKKIELITEQNDFKIKLKELESDLLFKLANAKGDILDDIDLIVNLEYSKKISMEIAVKVEIAKKTEKNINESSEFYRPAAARGALFYFLLTNICRVHSFYKYSLESYIVVINRAIDLITEKKEPAIKEGEQKEEGQQEKKAEGEENKPEGEENKPEGEEVEQKPEGEEEQKDDGQEQAEEGEGEIEPLSPKSLQARVDLLIKSITYTSFLYTRRGLFEKHKIIVTTMLTMRILIRQGKLNENEVNHLIVGKMDPNPGQMPEVTKSYLNETNWALCKSLETIPYFHQNNLCSSLDVENLQWKRWCDQEKSEIADLPKAFKDISSFHKLLLLRALRPDRLLSALTLFIYEQMGEEFVEQQPFDIFETYRESNANTPIFFVLFPGVDPTPEVERVAASVDISIANGRFTNISMGQGQELRAKKALFDSARDGNWVMLQNVHLMQSWLIGLNGLEGYLEEIAKTCHPQFRCFISSEPPPMADMNIIPESILQTSIKVANEAPQDLKANLRRSFAHFSQATVDKSPKPNEFKAILFSLCYFHSLILGRKKFATQGWSRGYNFNDGDLTICANVLHNYLAKYEVVPYDDLKYIFGEIMYGGHITDFWDRRTNNTYLQTLIKPELLSNCNLSQGFKSPDPSKLEYDGYRNYIETKLPIESPILFGLHPNAEIGYLTSTCDVIFETILSVQGGSSGGGKKDSGVMGILMDLKARAPVDFNMFDITAKIKEKTPYVVVALQECERMNLLLFEIKQSLESLRLGLIGALNITDIMEALSNALILNKVPANWEKCAYFSKKPLLSWFNDLIERNVQLQNWTAQLETPLSVCISYLFNPMSYLTAIMQTTSRKYQLPLNNMKIQTTVTQMRTPEEIKALPEQGMYIHGLFLEGAAWELGNPGQSGYLIDQKLKELHPRLPVVNVIAVKTEDFITLAQYTCPVYVTSMRGATFVFPANLQMESEDSDAKKWVLAGVCLLMTDD